VCWSPARVAAVTAVRRYAEAMPLTVTAGAGHDPLPAEGVRLPRRQTRPSAAAPCRRSAVLPLSGDCGHWPCSGNTATLLVKTG
jgi:hypothetical protein